MKFWNGSIEFLGFDRCKEQDGDSYRPRLTHGKQGALAMSGRLDDRMRLAWPSEVPLVFDSQWLQESFGTSWPTWGEVIPPINKSVDR